MKVRLLAVSALAASLGLAACSSSGSSSAAAPAATPKSSAPMASSSGAAMDFGPGCSAVPRSGAGSFTGMAGVPVASAASANPALSTLVKAVKAAGLANALNTAPSLTVFAPDNAAFAKLPPATLNKVLSDRAELTKILSYHVADGRHTPAQLATGMAIRTLEGGMVTPAVMSGSYTVNQAHVVCGNVQTANATVYIIDTVLMPPSS
jgi:uncharacterized surface protein with fasciclin (FAS1) repeats